MTPRDTETLWRHTHFTVSISSHFFSFSLLSYSSLPLSSLPFIPFSLPFSIPFPLPVSRNSAMNAAKSLSNSINKYEGEMKAKKAVFDKAKKTCECDGRCQLDGRGGRELQSAEYFAFHKKERTFMKEIKDLRAKVDLLKNADNTGLLYWQRKIKDYTRWNCCMREMTIQGKINDVATAMYNAVKSVDALLKTLKALVCIGIGELGSTIGGYLDATLLPGGAALNAANPLCMKLGPTMPKTKGPNKLNGQGWMLVSGELGKRPKDANGNDAGEPLEKQIAKEAGKMLVAFVSFKRPVFFQALVKFIIFAMMKTEIPELVNFLTKNKDAIDTLLYLVNVLWIAFCGKVFTALMGVLFDVVLCQMCAFDCPCKIGKLVSALLRVAWCTLYCCIAVLLYAALWCCACITTVL